mmetsp:Transcript_14752/g.30299  ORF Transcript_14752/g.30299 Transcript_14752/m.30299 type:complete len:86 (-) Transcript_14752:1329-1586(-)
MSFNNTTLCARGNGCYFGTGKSSIDSRMTQKVMQLAKHLADTWVCRVCGPQMLSSLAAAFHDLVDTLQEGVTLSHHILVVALLFN